MPDPAHRSGGLLKKTTGFVRRRWFLTSLFVFGASLVMTLSSLNAVTAKDINHYQQSPQWNEQGKFQNPVPVGEFGWSKIWGFLKRAMFEKKVNTVPHRAIPVNQLTRKEILALPEDQTSVIRLGHSTLLLKINNQLWLIDPVFSERASPFQWTGPKRFHQPPISIEQLPPLDGIIISHNHYDHMDAWSIKQLKNKVARFITPLGNADQIAAFGVSPDKLTELDWWQSFSVGDLTIVATPAQHFSGRGLTDRDKALWSSWVLKSETTAIFFSGDSGYFDGFKAIGEKYGPFDLTLIETGAYDKDWPDVHMTPAQSVQAHLDLQGKMMLPVHNGTFDLAFHAWSDPFEQLVTITQQQNVDLLTPEMGQVLTLDNTTSISRAYKNYWWQQ